MLCVQPHYPNSPRFYQLCDEYGFWVMGEADNEAHGAPDADARGRVLGGNVVDHWNKPIANNPDWIEATVDRVQLCVRREKNRPSIFSWSAGNEGAYGITNEESMKWIKQYDPTRVTHYSRVSTARQTANMTTRISTSTAGCTRRSARLKGHLKQGLGKPIILVEYCHAMGNGPGDFEDYYEVIRREPAMCGGFVWEWTDHAVQAGTSEDGRPVWLWRRPWRRPA